MDNNAIRREAERILKDADFHQSRPDNPFEDLLRSLLDSLKIKMPPLEKSFASKWIWDSLGGFLQILFYGLLLLIVVLMIYWFWKKISKKKRSQAGFIVSQAERLEARTNYLQQAEQAAQAQDYRLAMHSVFMAAVALAIQDVHFHKAEFLTNRELSHAMDFSSFCSPEELNLLFHEMLLMDEPRWFGTMEAHSKHYDAIRAIYSNFSSELTFKLISLSDKFGKEGRYA